MKFSLINAFFFIIKLTDKNKISGQQVRGFLQNVVIGEKQTYRKTMKNITRDEIKDAMQRYIADGGKIEKIKFKDNGMLLNNDLMLDRNFDNKSNFLEELQVNSIFEPEVVN